MSPLSGPFFQPPRRVPTARSLLTRLALAALLAIAPAVAARAEAPQAADAAAFADIRIGGDMSAFTLDNGLDVVVIPDRRAPVVTHMIWYKVGAADEPEGMSGIAHFLEHLMFKGTKDNPGNTFSRRIAEIGGQENAFTAQDYTAYFQRVAREHLREMMEMEADRMHNLVLSDEVVLPERDVVLEERRQRVDSDPGSILGETLDSMLFVNHPYGTPVIGWEDEILALNRQNAIDFYNRFYTPNNAILIVAGDVTADEVRDLAEATYGKVARRAEPGERQRAKVQVLPGAREVTYSDPRVNQPNMRKAWVVPSYNTAEGNQAPALEILSEILGGGSTSRLYRQLVVERGIAASAGSWYRSGALDDSVFMIYAVPADGTELKELGEAAHDVLRQIAADGVTAEELERAKKSLLSSALYAQDSQSALARIFGAALTTGGTIEQIRNWPATVTAITADDVKAAAATQFSASPVTAYLRGSEAAATTPPEAALQDPAVAQEVQQ
ncbi:pitrilysin family protein [Stappia sp. TSB10P1A]|uniref:M16 family metallopeptidase n=1 Tax=Stappia sp. TSB10P1A TaxID=2003585 RepID=UPI001FCB95FF|nr:pitrilysin family protein [Stappia sp. TSB10P1A]